MHSALNALRSSLINAQELLLFSWFIKIKIDFGFANYKLSLSKIDLNLVNQCQIECIFLIAE